MCSIEALVLGDQKDQVVLKVPPGTQNQLVLLVHQKKEFPIFLMIVTGVNMGQCGPEIYYSYL